jgi:uncharacterized DUF497 family protein
MIGPDFSLVEGFEWDEGNAHKNADKHDVSQGEAEQVFFNEPLLVMDDVKHNRVEPRLHAMGKTEAGRRLHVTFLLLHEGTKIRVISARDMSRKEREYYAKAS